MFRLALVAGLGLVACLMTPITRAEGVATCGTASAEGQGLFSCQSSWSYRAVSELSANTLVLTCRQNIAPGNQNMATCAYADQTRYVKWSTLTGTELVGYCAQTPHTPWHACDYPSGKEGWKRASEITSGTPPTTPPPTTPPPSGTGSATLSWSAVTRATDGTTVTITGYRIEYGIGNFNSVANSTSTSITLSNLAAGTWQFRVVAISSGGNSIPSSPVSRVISSGGTTTPPPTTPPPAPAVWSVAANGSSNSRPIYEAVLPAAGTALIRGNQEGTIGVGRTCGSEVFKIGTASYRNVTESEITLSSPTYAGRQHVAVCTQQP